MIDYGLKDKVVLITGVMPGFCIGRGWEPHLLQKDDY